MSIRATFSAARQHDRLAEQFDSALTSAGRPGPKPQFTQTVDVAFSPEQVRQMTRQASAERRSRNSLIRDAVEAYLRQAGA